MRPQIMRNYLLRILNVPEKSFELTLSSTSMYNGLTRQKSRWKVIIYTDETLTFLKGSHLKG